jgi:type I restriction enzyme S subunit
MATEINLRKGYKRTDIGVLPSDWSIVTYGTAFDFLRTAQYSRDQLNDSGMCQYIHYGDIHTKWEHFVDIQNANLPWIDESNIKNYSFVKEGDLIMADASEDYAGIGKSVEIKNIGDTKVISGLHTFLMRDKGDNFSTGFKGYIHSNPLVKRSMDRYATGLKVYGVSKNNLKLIQIPRPSLPEQAAIANTLVDLERLIESYELLVSKKRNLKEGVMQSLLTGKVRLSGFKDKWKIKKIEEFADITSGGTPSTLVPDYWGGSIKWMSSGELNYKIVNDVKARITKKGLENSSAKILPKKSVLIGLAGQGKTRGTVAMNMIELCTNQSIAAILPNTEYVPEYLFYNLEARYDELRMLSTGDGGRGGLNLTIIKRLPVLFPSFKEQASIALVLSDIDAELRILESKVNKYKHIKEAVVYTLLTGKIRLI